MVKKLSETHNLAHQFFSEQIKVLDLIKKDTPSSGFAAAVVRLVGNKPEQGKTVRIGTYEFRCSNYENNRLSFLPAQWQNELDKTGDTWSGCENWWAGYPLIAWVEIRASNDGTTGNLTLNAEVGPVSNHTVRKRLIEAIKMAAFTTGLERIHFPVVATEKGRLYSRFLRENSIAVGDIHNTDEIEKKFVELIAGFKLEFKCVASVIAQFVNSGAPASSPR